MTIHEVMDWLLAHGFERRQNGDHACAYRGTEVVVSFPGAWIATSVEAEGKSQRLCRIHANSPLLGVDRDGMIQGIGMTTFFYRLATETRDPPPWFPPSYAESVLNPPPLAMEP